MVGEPVSSCTATETWASNCVNTHVPAKKTVNRLVKFHLSQFKYDQILIFAWIGFI